MGFFSQEHRDFAYNNDPQGDAQAHEGKWSHELIGGAAAYEAMKGYEDHEKANGKPESHAKAKEIAAGLAGAEVDKLAETKGLDFIDKEKAKSHASDQLSSELQGRF